ncbi:MAG: hypothetical protein HYR72_07555 [Deltaproteobacteria bacterium]|nr:hypothetical protein [Deltaproteobacteria bacterium]MBI3386945.1 hypothetical protein [Deltaproteobacteria bacterium]
MTIDPAPFMRGEPDRFDEWLRYPLARSSSDPRVEVRRAQSAEFERIYDLIDEAFGVRRPRALYDWLYRRNPHGIARCWIVVERSSGRFVGNLTNCPWPCARGARALPSVLNADNVVAREWQGQGLNRVRSFVRDEHPMEQTIRFGWPNPQSQGAARKGEIDVHRSEPIPYYALPLHAAVPLIERGWPRALAAVAERTALTVLGAWVSIRLQNSFRGSVEPVRRFDEAYDAVTERCSTWDGYWFPHNADFLNWRYIDHPTRQYLPFAAVSGGAVTGYCVVQIDGHRAWLMDFAAPPLSTPVARALLLRAVTVARDAGCAWLTVCAPPRWPHWKMVKSAGFMKIPTPMYLFTSPYEDPDLHRLDRWQFLSGDRDGL